jgi:hypothetical protein
MTSYLFRFGFETPAQKSLNDEMGWDSEDSLAVIIEADSEQDALKWGQQVAERFVQLLFADDSVSWKAMNYANWIEHGRVPWSGIQRVSVGEYPDFEKWLRDVK